LCDCDCNICHTLCHLESLHHIYNIILLVKSQEENKKFLTPMFTDKQIKLFFFKFSIILFNNIFTLYFPSNFPLLSMLNMNIMKKYIKDLDNINFNEVMSLCFSQSKFYLKILGIPYYSNNLTSLITYNQIKEVIKEFHLFNDIVLAFWSCIIKVFPKSDMAII